jgi:DNA-directed RNA polymerase subunit RPC12/RpoP
MDDQSHVPAFSVHRVTLGGLIPLARYYNCMRCDHYLTDWVMKQSPSDPSTCPNCEVRIDERAIAQAQRDTKLGCLWTLASIAGLILAAAAIVVVIWLFTGPQPLIRFR